MINIQPKSLEVFSNEKKIVEDHIELKLYVIFHFSFMNHDSCKVSFSYPDLHISKDECDIPLLITNKLNDIVKYIDNNFNHYELFDIHTWECCDQFDNKYDMTFNEEWGIE